MTICKNLNKRPHWVKHCYDVCRLVKYHVISASLHISCVSLADIKRGITNVMPRTHSISVDSIRQLSISAPINLASSTSPVSVSIPSYPGTDCSGLPIKLYWIPRQRLYCPLRPGSSGGTFQPMSSCWNIYGCGADIRTGSAGRGAFTELKQLCCSMRPALRNFAVIEVDGQASPIRGDGQKSGYFDMDQCCLLLWFPGP